MNIEQIKDVIDELIYEAVIGKNPFKVGDLVKLRPDVLGRHASRKPAHAGFNKTDFSWRETLGRLQDEVGKIDRVSTDSKHVNVKYPNSWTSKDEYGKPYTVNSIGIDYTELIPANKPEGEQMINEVNYTTDKSTGKNIIAVGAPGSVARFSTENPHIIKAMRDWAKDVKWRDVSDETDIDDMSDEELLRGVNKHYQGGIKQFILDTHPRQTDEGFGYVYDKDMAKDPKHIKGERWRIKFQSAGDLKKHGNTEKSKVKNEQISISEVKKVIQELIKEMWIGWEEEEEGKIKEGDYFHPSDIHDPPPQIPGTEKLRMAKPEKEKPKIQKLPPAPKSDETPEQLRARLLAKLYNKDKTNEGEKKQDITINIVDKLKKK